MKYFKKSEISKCIIDINSSIKDVIESLSISSMQICLVTSKNSYLAGVLTDGDVRRGLLKGLDLNSKIESLIKRSPSVAKTNSSLFSIEFVMSSKSLLHVPVVDDDYKLKGLYTVDSYGNFKKKSNPVLIMAGGYGKRLLPFTENCPKPMLDLNGRPILEHIINNLSNQGFNRIHIALHYLGDNIKAYFKSGKKFGVNIKYIEEQKPLGTIGALGKIQYKGKEPIIVINGDALTSLDFSQLLSFHKKNKSYATLAVKEIKSFNPYGVVNAKGLKLHSFSEKPINRININTGIYVFSHRSKNILKKNKGSIDAPKFLINLKKRKKNVVIFPIHENWDDIGDKQRYLEMKGKNKI